MAIVPSLPLAMEEDGGYERRGKLATVLLRPIRGWAK